MITVYTGEAIVDLKIIPNDPPLFSPICALFLIKPVIIPPLPRSTVNSTALF